VSLLWKTAEKALVGLMIFVAVWGEERHWRTPCPDHGWKRPLTHQ